MNFFQIFLFSFLLCALSHSEELKYSNLSMLKKTAFEDTDLRSSLVQLRDILSKKDAVNLSKQLGITEFKLLMMGNELYRFRRGDCRFYYSKNRDLKRGWRDFKSPESEFKVKNELQKENAIPWNVYQNMVDINLDGKFEIKERFKNKEEYIFELIHYGRRLCKKNIRERIKLGLIKKDGKIRFYTDSNFVGNADGTELSGNADF